MLSTAQREADELKRSREEDDTIRERADKRARGEEDEGDEDEGAKGGAAGEDDEDAMDMDESDDDGELFLPFLSGTRKRGRECQTRSRLTRRDPRSSSPLPSPSAALFASAPALLPSEALYCRVTRYFFRLESRLGLTIPLPLSPSPLLQHQDRSLSSAASARGASHL